MKRPYPLFWTRDLVEERKDREGAVGDGVISSMPTRSRFRCLVVDEDINGPVTRAKARTLKEKLATYLESYFGAMDVELFRGKPYMMIRVEEEGGSAEEKEDCKKQP
ncbi:unnamed protein product [Linum tenue]|uniref:Uncharacterized protein n=1 Tax=Linum tenue TaxID=586396 RepID=A0AAV0IV71_9ROSI|nr:unnamed protein product [Linum tenue]